MNAMYENLQRPFCVSGPLKILIDNYTPDKARRDIHKKKRQPFFDISKS